MNITASHHTGFEPLTDGRFEFRIFDRDLSPLSAAFAREGKEVARSEMDYLYLVSRLNIEANVKVREGRLEVKTLEARVGTLERWRLEAEENLPVTAEFANDHAFSRLGFDHIDLPNEAMIGVAEIAAITEEIEAIRLLKVQKSRLHFEIGKCLAEYVQILWENGSIESAALESEQSEVVQDALRLFGMSAMENWSYPAFLRGIVFAIGS